MVEVWTTDLTYIIYYVFFFLTLDWNYTIRFQSPVILKQVTWCLSFPIILFLAWACFQTMSPHTLSFNLFSHIFDRHRVNSCYCMGPSRFCTIMHHIIHMIKLYMEKKKKKQKYHKIQPVSLSKDHKSLIILKRKLSKGFYYKMKGVHLFKP